ncbi:hypothetical protein [Nonomuraea sp. NPDC049158]|uniref:hypothetical protein n=1 Tax=Nonomuraea sp. NPDC049158 TaxID=3155649 RepID=UPI0034030A25
MFQDSGVSAAAAGWLLFVFQAVAVLTSLAVPAALRWARDQRAVAAVSSVVLLVGYLGLLVAPGWASLWSVVLGLGGVLMCGAAAGQVIVAMVAGRGTVPPVWMDMAWISPKPMHSGVALNRGG